MQIIGSLTFSFWIPLTHSKITEGCKEFLFMGAASISTIKLEIKIEQLREDGREVGGS